MAEVGFRQDLPPAGGYKPIEFKKVPLRPFLNGKIVFAGYLAMTYVGYKIYYWDVHKKRKLQVEEFDSNVAIEPILAAERDREYLKQLRRNREAERELMKNVPGWDVGKYFGEPVYKTCSENTFISGTWDEYYAHTSHRQKQLSRFFFYRAF